MTAPHGQRSLDYSVGVCGSEAFPHHGSFGDSLPIRPCRLIRQAENALGRGCVLAYCCKKGPDLTKSSCTKTDLYSINEGHITNPDTTNEMNACRGTQVSSYSQNPTISIISKHLTPEKTSHQTASRRSQPFARANSPFSSSGGIVIGWNGSIKFMSSGRTERSVNGFILSSTLLSPE